MKRATMKSSIVQEPKCRPEGRLFPRRRVAVKSHLLNGVGDFEMELSLAIQESLKYAQQEKEGELMENGFCNTNGPRSKENENRRDLSSMSSSRPDQPQVTNKAVHLASTMASSDWASEEVGRLKDLLVSQAELIQCQQNEIAEKDREIKALISAKDALQCRLERMERRMSMLKQKEESREVSGTLQIENTTKATSSSQPMQNKGLNEITSTELKKNHRRGHRLKLSHTKRHKRQRLMKPVNSVQETDREESEEDEDEESSRESDSHVEDESQNGSEDFESQKEKEDENESLIEQEERIIDYQVMQTETLYHLYYPKNFCSSPDSKKLQEQSEESVDTLSGIARRGFESPGNTDSLAGAVAMNYKVETPSWRLKPMTNMYQLEGTENITDEAYFKRHQKYELEEKRRKRWDLQRLRELRLSEKLQRQREDEIRASQDEVDVETFLPSIHDLKHIEKTDFIPVMAFGQPVPYASPAEFEIPWEINTSGPMTTAGRQRTNSVHSKKL